MASILGFEKKEKLSILKFMIEIDNHYNSMLLEASKFIQETATHFNLPNGVSEAYFMRTFEAKNILIKTFKNTEKERFFSQLLSYMLKNEKLSAIYIRMTDVNNGRLQHERERDRARLSTQFRQEWGYAFELTKEILKNHKLEYTDINPFLSKDYIFINETKGNSKIIAKQDSLKSESKSISRSPHSIDRKQQTPEATVNTELDIESLKRELRKELKEELIKDLKELIRTEVRNEFHSGMKSFVHNNFNETLYKDI